MRVLVIDDDARLVALLQRGLRAEGYAVDAAHDGLEGIERAAAEAYDVIILDVMMPRMNGYQVCAHLRSTGDRTPILMLSAKDGDYDQAEGLETGADDYLIKPFSFVVLGARLLALLRRSRPEVRAVQHLGDLEIDRAARRCRRAGTEVPLTGREFAVLACLAERPDTAVHKTAVLDAVWDSADRRGANLVEVYVSALRRKIDRPFGRASIETVAGGSYRLRSDGA
ncbi:response regulator transcription factor [Streptomyces fuscichromogenes]|uniref:DNA-binding response regulator n=1 Tax=Streptomyces fuscichromogenes TaxID=1324013 RepID=A0A918CVK7_9ACTN|nr:response regulator transcription factor [Streptomyces fuscichromogenes]GGN35136.1 DNA-binding response regulator [Streptomyces fuscichromogenes]